MTLEAQLPTTQRAYTLRLRRAPGKCPECKEDKCTCWRDSLWTTHEAVNKGAKVFGDWLLMLRGGLSHELADKKVIEGKGGKKKERDPTIEERRNRRILLALSWLSVEDTHGAPDDESVIIVKGAGSTDERERKLAATLADILKTRGVTGSDLGTTDGPSGGQPGTWLCDCMPSLSAAIRKDAVWVNRSASFDAVTAKWDIPKARKDAHALLSFILGDEFLTLAASKKSNRESVEADEGEEEEERLKTVKASSKGAGQRTRHPFSHLLGEGKPFGKPQRHLLLRDMWHEYVKSKLEPIGIPVFDGQKGKGGNEKDSGPSHTELQREMFSKAASRVAQVVTKQRQQEADRLDRKEADTGLRGMEADSAFNDALSALRTYCEEYRVTSSATSDFLIRPRQVTGWDRVVKKWTSIKETASERSYEARIEAVKTLQDENEDKKFGDANLFFRLAEDRFASVWKRDGKTDPTILDRFVKGMKARSDSERLKVAAFRHPDPYRNPIFCQFGVSRPTIRFRRLKIFPDAPQGNDPRAVGMLLWHPGHNAARLILMHGVSQRLDREIGAACDQVQHNAEQIPSVSRRGRLGAAAGGLASADLPARVAGVFDHKSIKSRYVTDEQDDGDDDGNAVRKPKEPKWNGTLSTVRRELEAIQRLFEKGEIKRALRRRGQLRWTLTVALEMEGRGPWLRFLAEAPDKAPFLRTARKDKLRDRDNQSKCLVERKGDKRIEAEGWPWQEFNRPLKENKDCTALIEDSRTTRGDKACLVLSRLPGLRVLSVDLGHRFAAACAVWEAISADAMKREIGERTIRTGGLGKEDLYSHVETPTDKAVRSGRNKGKPVVETTIYRRIAADTLKDAFHPAPWARLDRQFFVKLQGEECPARAATSGKLKNDPLAETNEVAMVGKWAQELGLLPNEGDLVKNIGVDELMRRAVRIAAIGLKRHGRRAKIANAFKPDCPGIPGRGGSIKAIRRGDNDHVKFLLNAIADWHSLSVDTDWDGSAARRLWNEHVKPVQGGFKIDAPTPPDPGAERPTRQQRRKSEENLREKLKPIAEHFAKTDATSKSIHEDWAKAWNTADGMERTKDDFEHTLIRGDNGKVVGSRTTSKSGKEFPGGWHEHLRILTDWVMGWRLPGTQSKSWNRNVGGLSLTRLATMRALYQLHKAFVMRPRPEKVQGAPERGESNTGVAQSILDAMERMREQRVKQLASRIVEGALGVGSEDRRHWKDGTKRPRQRIEDPRFAPCHAVVIENLRNYRPDELQTRRENRALMNWSAGKVRKYLEEACQLHGLHLREVQPNYTSRQCSRTGLPGLRCVEVAVDPASGKPKAFWWEKTVATARKKVGNGDQGNAESRFIADLADHLTSLKQDGKELPKSVRVPRQGGDLFVAAPPWPCRPDGHRPFPLCNSGRAIQADLNAAANIGLKALLDPDFPGKWWYIPCDSHTFKPHKEKTKGSPAVELDRSLKEPPPEKAGGKTKKGKGTEAGDREIVNLWRDVSTQPLAEGKWFVYQEYKNHVQARVINHILRPWNGLASS